MVRTIPIIIAALAATPSASAQTVGSGSSTATQAPASVEPGRTARSAVGEVGQRQTVYQTQGITPMARLSNRIENRIQLRIRNRIDRDYQADPSSVAAIATAEQQARSDRPHR